MPLKSFFKTAAIGLGLVSMSVTLSAATPYVGSSALASSAANVAIDQVAIDQTVIATGAFTGKSRHITTGGVQLVKTAQGYDLVLASDFSLDNAPTPSVGFGKNGKFIKASRVADLRSKTGTQTYSLPADFNPADFDEVYIWCDRFRIPLGVAQLSAA